MYENIFCKEKQHVYADETNTKKIEEEEMLTYRMRHMPYATDTHTHT